MKGYNWVNTVQQDPRYSSITRMLHESAVVIISEFILVDIFHKFTYGFRDNDF